MNQENSMNQGNALDLLEQLRGIVGTGGLILDDDLREFYSTDIRGKNQTTMAVVQPESVTDLQAVVAACARANVAVVPRGGGASYSGGYTINTPASITLDMNQLNRILEVNTTNSTVTVEAGVTWAALNEELTGCGLRTPFYGPFSGGIATIGGSLAQHAIALGSASFGVSADSVLNLDVVTGDGKLISTGSKAAVNGVNFFRYFGPDLTGLFMGNCGALGINARVTLRLIPRRKYRSFLSFSFDSFEQLAEGMVSVARLGVADCSFGNDPVCLEQMMRTQRQDTSLAAGKILAKAVFADAPNLVVGVWRVIKMAAAGQSFLKKAKYTCHVICDGHSHADVRGKIALVRKAASRHGRKIPNTIPMVISSNPYVTIPPPMIEDIRRGVPQHGVVPFDRVNELHEKIQVLYNKHEKDMKSYGIRAETMFSTISTHAFLYEPILTWPDTLSEFHRHFFRKEFEGVAVSREENLNGRELVAHLQTETARIFSDIGAINFQLGKTYPFWDRYQENGKPLMRALKEVLDPKGILNPGALGLPSQQSNDDI
jgi:glycolate oxidase